MPESDEQLVVVGRIRRSHGLKGVVVVEPMTARANEVFIPGREFVVGNVKGDAVAPEKRIRVEMAEPFQGGYRVQFDLITDRDEADRWRLRHVLSPRDELPVLDESEIYLHDLVGLSVEGPSAGVIGTVIAYYELRHDVMLEISRADAESVMIPYRFVTTVDLERKRVVVEPPEGLL